MRNLKKLSRENLKIIAGGTEQAADNNITDGEGGNGGGYYKCCSNNSDACSNCVYIKTNPVCSTGSYPVSC
ncbi:MAG: hypothetical protein MUW56_14855 [Chryseobacterium sp.]|uniref:bacteriocin-like protein n=1 Tax=Chryseobacterium sp. TaxID=1871047 RepID=UPI0025BCEEEA|nr:hypothetical protein [Chryseobacterium sp.]MCJ7934858.1 hypothetical protein [Chryseobacterium sp.]